MFFNFDRSIGFHTIHKCASTAIQNTFPHTGKWFAQIDVNAYMRLPRRITVIRDPFKRAESAYMMYVRSGSSWRHDLYDFESFILSISKPHKDENGNIQSDGMRDPHTMPMLKHMTRNGWWIPTEICRWDFPFIAKTIGVDLVKPANVAYRGNNHEFQVKAEWTDKARKVFEDWYAGDIQVWDGRIDCAEGGIPIDPDGLIKRELAR